MRRFLLASVAAAALLLSVPWNGADAKSLLAMFPFPTFSPSASGFGSPFYLGSYDDTSNASVYTFSSKELGGATSDRKIYCMIGTGAGTPVLTSCVIGGVTAELVRQQTSTSGMLCVVAEVPTGNTGNIVITFTTTMSRCAISLYATYSSDFAPHWANSDSAAGAVTIFNNVVNVNGYAICSSWDSSNGSNDISWSGTDTETLRYNSDVEATTHFSSASVGPCTETVNTGDWTCANNATLWAITLTIAKLNGASYYTPVLASHPSSTANLTTYTFAGANIGTAHANRVLIISVAWNASFVRAVSSFTVDGVSTDAIIVVQGTNSAILAIPWATGTTASIAVTMNGGCTSMGIGVYDTRPRSMIYPAGMSTVSSTATSNTCPDIGVRKGGFLIGACHTRALETQTAVYNGVDTLTIDAQDSVEDFTASHLSATITENKGTNDAGTSSASSVVRRMVCASFI